MNRHNVIRVLNPLLRFLSLWILLLVFMSVARALFIFLEPQYGSADYARMPKILLKGLSTDFTMAGYLMVIPGIIQILQVWFRGKWVTTFWKSYLWFVSGILAIVYILDATLFPFWEFRLDITPFFYFITSPSSALASMSVWLEIVLVLVIAFLTWGLYLILNRCTLNDFDNSVSKKVKITLTSVLVILIGFLFIPIRGGVTEATMTPGRGFFSFNMYRNQATINPMFSFVYSLLHDKDTTESFRFFENNDIASNKLKDYEKANLLTDSIPQLKLKTDRPDIYLFILESFSAEIMPSLGGDAIAVGLDSLAVNEGFLFSRFYAESFRTDRAIPTILSGYPALPTLAVMRNTSKLGRLPSLANALSDEGYESRYYYGGDADFTNMRAYLHAMDFDEVIDRNDFDSSLKISKWGVPDGYLFERVVKEIQPAGHSPRFTVVQTSSSHDPFDVPFTKNADKVVNAYMYTDSCLVKIVDDIKKRGNWDNTLIIMVADHWGCYPDQLTDLKRKQHIPLVFLGGALADAPAVIDITGSQADLAPTIVSLLNISNRHTDFVFGHNLFDGTQPHYARVCNRTAYGLIDKNDNPTFVSVDDNRVIEGNDSVFAKAFYQLLYSDINKR